MVGTVKAAAPAVLQKAREKLKHIFGFDLVQLPEAQKKGQHPLALHEVAPESERKTGAYAVINVIEAARELPDSYDPPVAYVRSAVPVYAFVYLFMPMRVCISAYLSLAFFLPLLLPLPPPPSLALPLPLCMFFCVWWGECYTIRRWKIYACQPKLYTISPPKPKEPCQL